MTDDSKLDKAKLAPIFEGELNRDSMAAALEAVMKEQSLSFRKAATTANISKSNLQKVRSATSTLDTATKVLSNLGYEVHFEVRRNDHS